MANTRQKLYTRLDAQGNRIAGSSVERLKRPRVGRWVEEAVETCCFAATDLTTTPADVTDDAFTLTILCDATAVLTTSFELAAATTTIDELVDELNRLYPYIGGFYVDGADIGLKLRKDVSDGFGCDGTLSFTVATT